MSSEDLMTEVDEVKPVEAHNAAKKQRMNAAQLQVSDDDIIQLNIGGKKITTTRSTLCQVEGSLLASMFSGRWEHGLVRDQKGCVFFDFNPKIFALILDYLRAKKIAGPEKPAPLPRVPVDQVENFSNLVEYLGLSDEIIPGSRLVSNEIFKLHSEGITVEEGGKAAVHDPSYSEHRYVLGSNVYQREIVSLKLKLESFHADNQWMLVGIVKGFEQEEDVDRQDIDSYKWSGCYGWALGEKGHVYTNGSISYNNTLVHRSKQGDTVELVLDCFAGKLTLRLPSSHQFHIDIPESETGWRLHINLHGANDKIRIIDE